jgi:sec-independent protein translocase protein TatA
MLPFVGSPGLPELLIIGVIALLLFGKRLPEIARSLGKGIVEFKKGVQGIEDDNGATSADS